MANKKVPKEIKETVFGYVDVDDIASFTTYERKWINKIKKWREEYPDKVRIVAENADGTMCAHLPKQWFKISPPKKISEDHRARMSELGKSLANKKKQDRS